MPLDEDIKKILDKYPDVRYSIDHQKEKIALDCNGDGELENHLGEQVNQILMKYKDALGNK
jgi:hypothetical protein